MDKAFRRAALSIARRDTTIAAMTDDHLTVEILAAYADGTLNAGERIGADRHLARCAACRRELAAIAELVATAPRVHRRPGWPVVAGGLAAAALAFVLVPRTSVPPTTRATERGPEPNASSVEIVAPAENGIAGPADSATIVWRSVPGATYRVTVSDTTGTIRWTTNSADTSAVVPGLVRLEPGTRYYLRIDALRSDGWSVQSGPRAFRTAR